MILCSKLQVLLLGNQQTITERIAYNTLRLFYNSSIRHVFMIYANSFPLLGWDSFLL